MPREPARARRASQLTPNPGGRISPEDLVGREAELARLMEAVSVGVGSQVLGERRMGKTSLLVKLEHELTTQGITAVRVSAETGTVATFTDRMLAELRRQRLIGHRISQWEKEFHVKAGLMISDVGLTLTGKLARGAMTAPELSLADLLTSVAESGPAVIIIDEITVLCRSLGNAAALELLRSLRALRQGSTSVSVVLSGSIGLHHALSDTTPLNDLWSVTVGPLGEADAATLTRRLLRGIGSDTPQALVRDIVTASSGIPFYIHALVDQLRSRHPSTWNIDLIVGGCLAEDTWKTKHYVARLPDYYGTNAGAAATVLDAIATSNAPMGVTDVAAAVLAADLALSRPALVQLLEQLVLDHYLLRTGNSIVMSSALLTRAWKAHRWLD